MQNPFASHHFIDRETGKVHRKYTYKRKPCKTVELTSKRAKKLAGYALIEKDLRSCLAWLDEIDRRHDEGPTDQGIRAYHGEDRANFVIIKGLFVALLTFYAKCFTRCPGRRVKVDQKQLVEHFHELHEHLMMLRHNFAAHSGEELVEQARVVAVYSPLKKGKSAIWICRELEQPDVLATKPGELSVRKLLEHVRGIAQQKIEELSTAVLQEEATEAVGKVVAGG